MTAGSARPLAIWTALIIVYIVWGSTYLGIRVVVESGIPPLFGMGTRFTVAALVLGGYLALTGGSGARGRGRRRLRVTRRELAGTAAMGVMLLVLGNGMVAVAEQTVPSGLTALIVGAVPLWFVLLRVSGGDRPRRLTWVGVLVGLGGIAAICLPRGGIDGVEAWGVLVLLFATMSWATGSYLSPRLGLPRDGLVASTYEMLIAGVIMVLVSLVSGEAGSFTAADVPTRGWIALAYLVIIGSLLGYTAYTYALAHAPLSLVGTYAYVNPVVAVILGWLILDEPITAVVLGGGGLVVVGVALVVGGERPAPKPTPATESSPERTAA